MCATSAVAYLCDIRYRFVRRGRRRWNLRRWSSSTSCSGTATGIRRCRPWHLVPPSSCDPGRVGTIWPGQETIRGSECRAAGRRPCTVAGSAKLRSPGLRGSCRGIEKERKTSKVIEPGELRRNTRRKRVSRPSAIGESRVKRVAGLDLSSH